MIEYKEEKINYIILDVNGEFELLVRAEKENNSKGISITKKTIDEINDIVENIKDWDYSKTVSYLKDNSIKYKELKFI